MLNNKSNILFYLTLTYESGLIDVEIERQITELKKGHFIVQETRGYDVVANQTFRLRTKETSADYRYMPEPDIPSLIITKVYYYFIFKLY